MSATGLLILAWLALHGYGPAQREAVVDNARIESGLRPEAVSRAGDIGLWQWRGTRRRALIRFAVWHGDGDVVTWPGGTPSAAAWRDPVVQLRFMDREWRANPASRAFFAAASRGAAFRIFCRHFERRRCR